MNSLQEFFGSRTRIAAALLGIVQVAQEAGVLNLTEETVQRFSYGLVALAFIFLRSAVQPAAATQESTIRLPGQRLPLAAIACCLGAALLMTGCAGGQASPASILHALRMGPGLEGVVVEDARLVTDDGAAYLSAKVLEIVESRGGREGTLRELRYGGAPIEELRKVKTWLKKGQRVEALENAKSESGVFDAAELWRRNGIPAEWVPLVVSLFPVLPNSD